MDLFLRIDMPFHLICAVSGLVFGLGAIAFVNKRGLHRAVGRVHLIAMVLLTVSGLAMLADPLFRNGVATILAQPGAPQTVFEDTTYLDIAFVAIAVITANGVITGARVWTRVKRSTNGVLYAGWFDWAVTLATIPPLALFAYVGFLHAQHGNQVAFIMASISTVAVVMQLVDVHTYLRPPVVAGKSWWLLHMMKMLGALAGLLQAVAVRHAVDLPMAVVVIIAAGTLPTLIFISVTHYRGGLRRWIRQRRERAHRLSTQ